MAYNKPYLTLPQQIALLESRGMGITDRAKAETYLERIGYYRLSGYWFPFRESTVKNGVTVVLDTFKAGIDFATIVDLYVFDKKLRLLLLDAIERIEIALRVQTALLLGGYGPWAHRDPARLHGNFARRPDPKTQLIPHREWLRRTDEAFDRSKEEFAKHFRTKYAGDNPPIWIACELWDFGALSVLFGGMTKADQTAIAKKYAISQFDVMETWIRAINVARNVCAHHSRLWNRPLAIQPKWPAPGVAPDLAHLHGNTKAQTRVYGMLTICRFLLQSINPTTKWPERVKALCAEFPTAAPLNLKAAGFPDNWIQQSLWS